MFIDNCDASNVAREASEYLPLNFEQLNLEPPEGLERFEREHSGKWVDSRKFSY